MTYVFIVEHVSRSRPLVLNNTTFVNYICETIPQRQVST